MSGSQHAQHVVHVHLHLVHVEVLQGQGEGWGGRGRGGAVSVGFVCPPTRESHYCCRERVEMFGGTVSADLGADYLGR